MISLTELIRDDPDAYDIYLEEKHKKEMQRRYWAHPDCRDPDHIGCPDCEPSEEDNQEEEDEDE